MNNVASIVVDNNSKAMDKVFDYIIPNELSDIVKVGARVIVPFGKGDRCLEGYVLEITNKEDSKEYQLKSIKDIVEEDTFLNEDMLELAYFIKQKYHCTLNEAFKTIIPSGVNLKEKILIKKLGKLNMMDIKDKYINILNLLDDNKYMEYKKLNVLLGGKLTRADIFYMYKMGIVEVRKQMKQSTNIKTIDVYSPGNSILCNNFINDHSQKYKRQIEVLRSIINNNDNATMKELCEKYKCSPAVVKALAEKNLIVKSKQEIIREADRKNYFYGRVRLTPDQNMAIKNIYHAYKNGKNISLIFGVTGCGKTEIYLNLVEDCIRKGFGAIILVPEISLTPQTVERFKGRFGDIVAVIHSKLSDGERYDEWRKIKSGEKKVVVGARSAIFAPVDDLKLVIIDEEHEYSYKSESTPKYHTREIAEYRISKVKGLLILGSATPSLESFFKAEKNEYNLIKICRRVNSKALPQVNIVDMRKELINGNKSMFSQVLYDNIKLNLENKNQTILFLNRRGHSTFVSCRNCGYVVKCDNCDVSMTYHMSSNKLSCHYCGIERPVPHLCPKCGSKYIKYFGVGTERVEYELKKYFPKARVIRMDLDTTRKKGEYEKLYNQFKNNEADILIGTQMISKGMDFKNVTLVGVISADTMLNLPDFRSAERTFQILTQVSGRAGRGELQGKVIVQSYDIEHYSILYSSDHDFERFYVKEIEIRKVLRLPPFTDILYALFTSENEKDLINYCMKLKEKLSFIRSNRNIDILGPTPCYISKIKNNYRWHVLLKGDVSNEYMLVKDIIEENIGSSSINYSLDINPYNMF